MLYILQHALWYDRNHYDIVTQPKLAGWT
jgi:hypothetical protein